MMKANVLAKGYVMPYNAMCCIVIPLIFSAMFVCGAIFFAQYAEIFVAGIMLALLCCLLPIVSLTFDKTAMRYGITDTCVQSRSLLCTHCRLPDAKVRQIELQWADEIWKDFANRNALYLVCSDKYYEQVKYIAVKYHRKNQVVVRITRKNFSQVQAYLARMGVSAQANNYDALMLMLKHAPMIWRMQDSTWAQK